MLEQALEDDDLCLAPPASSSAAESGTLSPDHATLRWGTSSTPTMTSCRASGATAAMSAMAAVTQWLKNATREGRASGTGRPVSGFGRPGGRGSRGRDGLVCVACGQDSAP